MKIKMFFPAESMDKIKAMGLRQASPEILRWTTGHPASSYGLGVLVRGRSGDILDGAKFSALRNAFGAWIEVDSDETKQRVKGALALIDADNAIIVVGGNSVA